MAIIRTIPRKGRRPAHTGRIMIDTVRGVLRVRKWPRKRPGPRTAIERFWSDWFTQANKLAKYADAMSQVRAIEMTKGSGMYPRDVLLKAMRGRLYAWTTPDGWKWYSMAAIGDISESLDVLAQTVGDVLVRAVDRWRPPPAGIAGDVLTNAGPGLPPGWAAAGAVTSNLACLVTLSAPQSIAHATNTPVSWDTEHYDDASIHDPAVNPTRFTAPAGTTRMALVGQASFATPAGPWQQVIVWKNGASPIIVPVNRKNTSGSGLTFLNIPPVAIPMDPGDYLELVVQQQSGGNLNLSATPWSWCGAILNP